MTVINMIFNFVMILQGCPQHVDEADVRSITAEQKAALLLELKQLADSQPEKFPVPLLNIFTDILKLAQNPHWNKIEFHIYYGFPHTRIFTEL